ncbi:MAG: phosphatidylglycerophosphatase A [candidate division Zixibacteria bacterium]|nr:phosphatidylglycerophosphatase A [candidate division Zixibacteria bacterium]
MNSLLKKMQKSPIERGNKPVTSRPFAVVIASFFGIGYLPAAPGTWGSLAAIVVAYSFFPVRIVEQLLVVFTVTLIGIYASYRAEDVYGKDGGEIVIDEVAGIFVSIIAIPKSVESYALAFILFRLFDIVKPFPARRSERIPYGVGVMADDVVAGIYAAILTFFIYHLYTNLVGNL